MTNVGIILMFSSIYRSIMMYTWLSRSQKMWNFKWKMNPKLRTFKEIMTATVCSKNLDSPSVAASWED